ncbi:hypothetical protein [Chryseobacterium indologenes]|uniref:Uncharacterized protein n=1 Tax=Chryseobacterium indologenes TaxID=253 RepID=A0A0N0ITV7_CHRID|nr:hypothetical protein [Chryseobacterium indologenes]KPE49064.1 hypothetical protein AOB46_21955 [Chryseobacterium indologenes]
MWINCKIISENDILLYKLKEFISKTPFFLVPEENKNNTDDYEQIIFWDIDSVNIDVLYLKNYINKGGVVIIMTSVLSKNIISEFFTKDQMLNIGILNKNIQHNQFIEEIERVIELSQARFPAN